ncbi:hypothetical protein B0T37_19445 [Chromobacterium violaceum]|uniref:hypothetical protein n=1 Tax=Chromobacterium violaceum TaxID=536 RepID=UPI0009DB2537|nr:hypothetical protein [Chromobacterium violaceum]OQS08476.1 hypothetical protein B0T38_19850 [Chromobacterium violaceum]OQS21671.1 hypothetical protein B0T37_19445 [Chromobacterium violaceum]
MFQSYGYIDNASRLGDYCRSCLGDDKGMSHLPDVPNDTWELYKCLRLTDELLEIFGELDIFQQLARPAIDCARSQL